jgi:glycosyltransferase involved in cell wall biosynthesis
MPDDQAADQAGRGITITVVTACFNQAHTLEKTLKSVLEQEYPGLEYIVMDGGSRDGTLDIIEKHRHRISRVVSGPDQGQYHAIAGGLNAGTGEIMAWLNGDDVYFPWTFRVVADIFAQHPDVDWIVGLPAYLDSSGTLCEVSNRHPAYVQAHIRQGYYCDPVFGYIQQESMFWRRRLWDRAGGLDTACRYAADYELWTRFAEHAVPVAVAVPLAAFRMDPARQRSRVFQAQYLAEVDAVFARRAGAGGRILRWLGRRSHALRLLMRFAAVAPTRVIAKSILDPGRHHAVRTWSNRMRKSFFGMMLEFATRREMERSAGGRP